MAEFFLKSGFKAAGDQPQAIEKLTRGLENGVKNQVLLGVTGSGKTFTVANVIRNIGLPTLVVSHNKTLAAQLAQEYREFFPDNAVEYFVSYYDYYQPESYIPQRDIYIEKEADINLEVDKLRLSTTASLLSRRDVIVVASVSCIYNLGSPEEYERSTVKLDPAGTKLSREELIGKLVSLFYKRSDYDFVRSSFRVRGAYLDLWPSFWDVALRIFFDGDGGINHLEEINPLTGEVLEKKESAVIFPAKHYITSQEIYEEAFRRIREDLSARTAELKKIGRDLEAHRLNQRTKYDLEMIRETGYCNGIENYSGYFEGRAPGEPPFTLLDYFPKGFLMIIDESHITLPQIRGMYHGDRTRKETLIEHGFRLPSAIDNRPLRFEEFVRKINQVIYTSATPGEYEISLAKGQNRPSENFSVVEQLIRPTGLLDPKVEILPTKGQIEDLIGRIKGRVGRRERVLVTTLTKRLAEELTIYLSERGLKVQYLHSDIETLERSDILDNLRAGKYDVVVGINLLREGLDLPEVSLVAILDADKEGFLRSQTSLIQTMGRAARHVNGTVLMYADSMTGSMRRALDEVSRRRRYQGEYNRRHRLTPRSIEKSIRKRLIERAEKTEPKPGLKDFRAEDFMEMIPPDRKRLVKDLELKMKESAELLDFESSIRYRDKLRVLKKLL